MGVTEMPITKLVYEEGGSQCVKYYPSWTVDFHYVVGDGLVVTGAQASRATCCRRVMWASEDAWGSVLDTEGLSCFLQVHMGWLLPTLAMCGCATSEGQEPLKASLLWSQ